MEEGMGDVNSVWMHVSRLGDASAISTYPRLLAQMMAAAKEAAYAEIAQCEILLPSDHHWQDKIYYQLVDKQRTFIGVPQTPLNFLVEKAISPWDTTIPQPPVKKPRCTWDLDSANRSRLSISSVVPITWTVSDIYRASCLLFVPPIHIHFKDEHEMRSVYTLIYDVFRYKNILDQALSDVAFFFHFSELKQCKHQVWLLLYDMYHRKFKERESTNAAESEELFPVCGLTHIEDALWTKRVKLAAAMSRLRVAHNALRLSEMLPLHLRDEKLTKLNENMPFTCWVNNNKVQSPNDIIIDMEETLNLQLLSIKHSVMGPQNFRWDPLCPLFLSFHRDLRTTLAQSPYVHDSVLVMQNRSFCYGPAVFCRILTELNLTGTVVQSHPTSMRATAYFATLLAQNEQIFSLLLFGVGESKAEYEEHMRSLGIKNVIVYSEELIDAPPDMDIMEQVVGVLVTPPNSYSAVNDPIDLICSRGGDLMMLEALTDIEASSEGQARVIKMLQEQRMTLRYSMSRPQIQFVLYETHSQLPAENSEMVKQALHEINRAAQIKHAELQGKINITSTASKPEITASEAEINNNEANVKQAAPQENASECTSKLTKKQSVFSLLSLEMEEEVLKDIKVPDTDIFEEKAPPDLCFNSDACVDLEEEGCFLALLQRKEVIRMDAKYMIKMAEMRGLFGNASKDASQKTKSSKSSRNRKQEQKDLTLLKPRRRGSFKVERIAAHTHASLMRNSNYEHGEHGLRCCPKHHGHDEVERTSPAKLWWAETTRYLTKLRKTLIKQKVINTKSVSTNHFDKINKDIHNIDEILSNIECTRSSSVPMMPKLRLTRCPMRLTKVPFPISINTVELPARRYQ